LEKKNQKTFVAWVGAAGENRESKIHFSVGSAKRNLTTCKKISRGEKGLMPVNFSSL
jgi:hypothetical protein